jgi:hypothetical protein
MHRKNFPHRKEIKRNEAKARQEAYSKLTTQQKLDRLTAAGITKGRQHLRLIQALANNK